jgi:hypothetical protein
MDQWRVRLCVGLLAAFWVLIAIGGAVNDGYRQYLDFISSLAARGGDLAWLGVLALLAVAAAHLVVVPVLRRQDRGVAGAVLAAGCFLVVVAVFPIRCPGAEYCGPIGEVQWLDIAHMGGVLGYSLVMVIAMVRAGVLALRIPVRRTWGIASLVAAMVFIVALVLTQGATPGLSQRFWVLAGQVWLVAAAITPFATRPGTRRRSSGVARDAPPTSADQPTGRGASSS